MLPPSGAGNRPSISWRETAARASSPTDARINDISPLLLQPTRLLGRERELEAIRRLLLHDGVRLLTLAGPAGVGKTRLALETRTRLAASFADGVTFVDLAEIRNPEFVLAAIAEQLGLVDVGAGAIPARLSTFLQNRAALLILDNFEQVVSAAADLGRLLAECPNLSLLVTSRFALHLRWEHVLRVESLSLPDLERLPSLAQLLAIPSVTLFLERAAARRPDFTLTDENAATVAGLCVRLDGIPLGIELAAAWMDTLQPAVISGRLGKHLSLLKSQAPDLPLRHRSLHAAIDWSYELLSEEEQLLFRQAGVFAGRMSLGAISEVAGSGDEDRTLEILASLAEKSFIVTGIPDGGGEETFFRVLETMREYAREQLEAHGELDRASTAHADYYLALTERADPELRGAGQRTWFLRLEREHDNLRVALRWLLDRGDPRQTLRLTVALRYFWWQRGYRTEGCRWLQQALDKAEDVDPVLRAGALTGLGNLLIYLGELEPARAALEEALALAADHRSRAAEASIYLGFCLAFAGENEEGMGLLREARDAASRAGDASQDHQAATASGFLGVAASMHRRYDLAEPYLQDAVSRFLQLGDRRNAAGMRIALASVLVELGDRPRAEELVREGIRTSTNLRDRYLLNIGAEIALLVLGERTEEERWARLFGAWDELSLAFAPARRGYERFFGNNLATLREDLKENGLELPYREGRRLSFDDTAELALELLADFSSEIETGTWRTNPHRQQGLVSPREGEVLHLVAEGLTDRQIATKLGISERTVRRHLTSILNKLGATNRPHAVAIAARRKML